MDLRELSLPGARAWVVSILAIVLLDLVVLVCGVRLIADHESFPFDTDEATHALSALRLADDLRAGDVETLHADLYAQSTYPPVASVIRAIAFLAFGTSASVARGVSLVCLLVSTAVLALLALELDRRRGWFIALWAVTLTLVAPLFLQLGALCMLETPGLMTSLLALWLYLRASARRSWLFELGAGLALAVVMLTKYPFGLGLLGAILANELIAVTLARQSRPRRWLLMGLGFLVPMAYWFAHPSKLLDFMHYATMQPAETTVQSMENLLFYPRVISLHYFPSTLLGLVGLAGFLWGLRHGRNGQRRVVLLYFTVGLVMLVLKTQNEARFLATFVPALYLLSGALVVDLWGHLCRPTTRHLSRLLALAVGTVIIVSGVLCVAANLLELRPMLQVAYETDPPLADAARWILEETRGASLCVIDPWDQLSVQALAWAALVSDGPESTAPGIRGLRLSRQISVPEVVKLRAALAQADYAVVLARQGTRWPEVRPLVGDLVSPSASRQVDFESFWEAFADEGSRVTREAVEELRVSGQAARKVDVLLLHVNARPRGSRAVVRPQDGNACETWPEPSLRLPPSTAMAFPDSRADHLEFDSTSKHALLAGWSGFESTPQGTSFVWAVGCEAYVVLSCGQPEDRRIALRLWPFHHLAGEQEVRGVLNGRSIGVARLTGGPQVLSVAVPAERWREGANLLVLQLARAVAPTAVGLQSADRRPLAAAVDWIRIEVETTRRVEPGGTSPAPPRAASPAGSSRAAGTRTSLCYNSTQEVPCGVR